MKADKLTLLTAEIARLSQERINLSEDLTGRKCRGCFDDDAKYELSDSEVNAWLCLTCIQLIKAHSKCSLRKNPKNDCPICHSDDGKYLIEGLTATLCKSCFKAAKEMEV
jgi:rubrerythrin